MAANEFLLRIVGDDVSPQTVDVLDLGGVVRGFRGALEAVAVQSRRPADKILLGLTGVSGSAPNTDTLTLYGSKESIDSAKSLIRFLNGNAYSKASHDLRKHLRDIWKVLYRNGWDACEFEGNGSRIGTAKILLANELFPEPGTFRGETVLYGECFRTGGEGRKTASLKLLNGERLTVQLKSKELAQSLGQRLYQTIGLAGEGIWRTPPRSENKTTTANELIEFRADRLTEFVDRDEGATNRRTIKQAFDELANAAGNRWDGIDPEEFVKEQRRD